MKHPPRWNEKQLTSEVEKARTLFREERLDEPLEKWKTTFDQYEDQFNRLFDDFGIANPESLTHEKITQIFKNQLGDALRYLAGPPISADDLKVLAEASLAPGRIAIDPDASIRILNTIIQTVDPRRFPWIAEKRKPTQHEKAAAILASTALITAQRVSTDRRNKGKDVQEQKVRTFLVSFGFKEVPTRQINTLADAPEIGEFCGESMVGSRKADVPIRLYDGRLMPVECKVSNSSTNSVKRINNDAQVKASIWNREFGINQVVPSAVLSGVFKVHNLVNAQEGGLTLFWAHKLKNMKNFINATRT